MEHTLAELPLAIFTTLAPIAAGAYVTLALAFLTTSFTPEQSKRIDAFTWIPLMVLVIAFIAAVFHLTQVWHAINVFAGAGRSPLSNEVMAGIVFFILALIYSVLGAAGKLSGGIRKALIVIIAAVGLVFALSVGMAYLIETIISWNTPLVPVTVIGYCLLGGGMLGLLVLGIGGVLPTTRNSGFKVAFIVMLIIGTLMAGIGLALHVAMVSEIMTPSILGSQLVAEVLILVVMGIGCMIFACASGCFAVVRSDAATLPALGLLLAVVGIFLGRLIFYALQISVGL